MYQYSLAVVGLPGGPSPVVWLALFIRVVGVICFGDIVQQMCCGRAKCCHAMPKFWWYDENCRVFIADTYRPSSCIDTLDPIGIGIVHDGSLDHAFDNTPAIRLELVSMPCLSDIWIDFCVVDLPPNKCALEEIHQRPASIVGIIFNGEDARRIREFTSCFERSQRLALICTHQVRGI